MVRRTRYPSFDTRRQGRRSILGWLVGIGGGLLALGLAWWSGALGRLLGRDGAPAAGSTPAVAWGPLGTPRPAGSAATAAPPAIPPSPTPEPHTPARTARRYLDAWQAKDYAGMHALLTAAAQARVTKDAFVGRYEAITEEAGITKVTAVLSPGVPETAAKQSYEVKIETRLGPVTEQHSLTLEESNGTWAIDWQTTLIFKDLTGERLVRFLPENPVRGRILDRSGVVLAVTGEAPVVGVIRADIKNEAAMLAALAQRLGMDQEAIKRRYASGQPDWWMPVKRLSWRTKEPELVVLQAIDPGIQVRMQPERIYPENSLAAHVVGYVTEVQAEDLAKGHQLGERVGRAGVEAGLNKELAGQRGGRLLIVERNGSPAATLIQKKARPGADLTLTIDLAVQRVAEEGLGDKRGAVVVLDPKNGAIRAMASKPAFDPNTFVLGFSDEAWKQLNDPQQRPLTNRTIDGLYPPGSIFKVVTMSTGMEKLGMPRDEGFSCSGSFKLPRAPQIWLDWKVGGHGQLNLVRGLTTSCDIVFYTIGQRADAVTGDATLLADMARSFGLGAPTGLTELADAAGNVPDAEWKQKTFSDVWATGDTINFSIGQGFLLVTPLQMALIYAAIAHDGTLWTPYLTERLSLPGGPDIRVAEPKGRRKVPIQPSTVTAIRDGLNQVPTALGGTGYLAFKDYVGPPAAGKTGTAETGVKGVTHAWFAAYAPQVDAKLVCISLVEEGKDAEGEGSRVAAPIARLVFERILAGVPAPGAAPPPPPPTVAPTPARKPGPAPTPTKKP